MLSASLNKTFPFFPSLLAFSEYGLVVVDPKKIHWERGGVCVCVCVCVCRGGGGGGGQQYVAEGHQRPLMERLGEPKYSYFSLAYFMSVTRSRLL